MTDGALEHDAAVEEEVLDGVGSWPGEAAQGGVETGVPAVDAALERLQGLGERPVEEHPEVFEAVHGALRGVLGGDGS